MMKLTECPRDAMQGIHDWIPSQVKIDYLNQLLQVGFNTLDFGSFVSPKAIPQMKDTQDVLKGLKLDNTQTKLLAIVANQRGAKDAASFDEINFLGYPFSISEEFQMRNTRKTIDQSLASVEEIKQIADNSNKKLVIYISMAFGNPYGEKWHPDIAIEWSKKLNEKLGIEFLSLSDTIGISNKSNISFLFKETLAELKNVTIGAHLHTTPETWKEKIQAAVASGCTHYEGALKGFGGCPMAKDDLTGNMPTEKMIGFFLENKMNLDIQQNELNKSLRMANEIFSKYS